MQDLVEAIATRLQTAGLTLAVAEASTGGCLADALTDRPGASAYFLGGIAPYDNRSKIELLGVPADLLATHGAASIEVATALATGVRRAFASDIGLAITGLLGPRQGRSSKPAGLTCVAAARADEVLTCEHRFTGNRRTVKVAQAEAALRLLLEMLSVSDPGG